MLSKQEEINLKNIKKKLQSPTIHKSIEQEKFEYAKMQERRKQKLEEIRSRPKSERKIYVNCINEFVDISHITEDMEERECELGNYLYNN